MATPCRVPAGKSSPALQLIAGVAATLSEWHDPVVDV
jgi:hypothetical protein